MAVSILEELSEFEKTHNTKVECEVTGILGYTFTVEEQYLDSFRYFIILRRSPGSNYTYKAKPNEPKFEVGEKYVYDLGDSGRMVFEVDSITINWRELDEIIIDIIDITIDHYDGMDRLVIDKDHLIYKNSIPYKEWEKKEAETRNRSITSFKKFPTLLDTDNLSFSGMYPYGGIPSLPNKVYSMPPYSYLGSDIFDCPTQSFKMSFDTIDIFLKNKGDNMIKYKKIIFKEPATIVFWEDGTKTIVKCRKDETFNRELGFLYAFFKKVSSMKSTEMSRYLKDVGEIDYETFYFVIWDKNRKVNVHGSIRAKCKSDATEKIAYFKYRHAKAWFYFHHILDTEMKVKKFLKCFQKRNCSYTEVNINKTYKDWV